MKIQKLPSHVQQLYRHGEMCQKKLLVLLNDWPVAEYSMRIDFKIRTRDDQELIRRTLQEAVQWVKAVGAERAAHDRRVIKDIVRRLEFATLEEDFRKNGVDDARDAMGDALSLVGTIALPHAPEANAEDRTRSLRKGAAFIIMAMNLHPETEDACEAIKAACNRFGIRAVRADDIRHSGLVIDVVYDLIATSEFLIADLSWERQNVYWETGVARGLKKQPILVCRQGTKLHFNLAGNNVLEYRNCTELKRLLIDRLKTMPRAA